MKKTGSLPGSLSILVLCITFARAQTEFVGSDFFPAQFEFKELGAVKSESTVTDQASLPHVPDGRLFTDVGVAQYARRVYSVVGGGDLSIEVVRLKDARGAYSLLSILRSNDMSAGPPGDWYSRTTGGLIFVRGEYLVRVHQDPGDQELSGKVAISVSNRIGNRGLVTPQLIAHFPKTGYQAGSVRYFLGPRSYASFATAIAGNRLKFESDMEIAQAQYEVEGMRGLLSLVSFPTSQLAEQSFDDLAGTSQGSIESPKVYLKRVGPLLGILEGTFDAGTADKLLGSIQFKYAIKWIYDKNNRSNGKTIWGVPMPILGTVVRSLLFTGLLCGLSLLGGIGIAVFRFFLRGYAPHNFLDRPERTEMIRLKLNEK